MSRHCSVINVMHGYFFDVLNCRNDSYSNTWPNDRSCLDSANTVSFADSETMTRKRTADIMVADAEAAEPYADKRSTSAVCNCTIYCNQEVSADHNMLCQWCLDEVVSVMSSTNCTFQIVHNAHPTWQPDDQLWQRRKGVRCIHATANKLLSPGQSPIVCLITCLSLCSLKRLVTRAVHV